MPPKRKPHDDDSPADEVPHKDTLEASAGPIAAFTQSEFIERLIQTQTNSIAALVDSQKSSISDLIKSLPICESSAESTVKKLKVPRWSDEQHPSSYLDSYEQVMMENKEPKPRWASLLRHYISGNLLAAFNADITPDILNDYDAVRHILLQAMGDTAEQAARKWWEIQKRPDESFHSFYQRISILNNKRLEHLGDSKKDILNYITLSRFLESLPTFCYNYVVSRKPVTGRDAATLATEFFQSQSKYRQSRPYTTFSLGTKSNFGSSCDPEYGQSNQCGEHTPSVNGRDPKGVTKTDASTVPTTFPSDFTAVSNNYPGSSRVPYHSGMNHYNRSHSIVRHGCGEPGHIRPNCPNKQIKRVKSPTRLCDDLSKCKKAFINGTINSIPCTKLLVDSGCEITCISSLLVPPKCYTGHSVLLQSFRSSDKGNYAPLAKVHLKIDSFDGIVEVAV